MEEDPYCPLIAAYVLGSLEGKELTALQAHLDEPCPECRAELATQGEVLRRLADRDAYPPPSALREHVLEFADVPRLPFDPDAYSWEEVLPGVRIHTLREDPERGLRAVLVWARPGAVYPTHRHLGDEEILVLQGAMRDHRGVYGPGDICRSRAGSVHSEEAMPGEDCVCYVVYHGEHERLPS